MVAKTAKFDVRGMAKAGGAIGVIFVASMWIGMQVGWGMEIAMLMQGVYLGFDASVMGLVKGLIWGVLDGGIGMAIFACIYNKVSA